MNENILFYAFRYALGRKTYAVNEVIEEILKNKDNLLKKTKLSMIKEIDHNEMCELLGHEYDKKQWLELRKTLIKTI